MADVVFAWSARQDYTTTGTKTFAHTCSGQGFAVVVAQEGTASPETNVSVDDGSGPVFLTLLADGNRSATPGRRARIWGLDTGLPVGAVTVSVKINTGAEVRVRAVDVSNPTGGIALGPAASSQSATGTIFATLDSGAALGRGLAVISTQFGTPLAPADHTLLDSQSYGGGGGGLFGIIEEDAASVGSRGVGFVSNSIHGGAALLWETVASPDTEVAPDAFGTEVGFFDGLTLEAEGSGEDVELGFLPLIAEAGFFPGLRLSVLGVQQIMLSTPDTEHHGLTTLGGVTGDVATKQADGSVGWGPGSGTAATTTYDDTASGLGADDVQDAIDTLADLIGAGTSSLHIETISGAHDIDAADGATHLLTLSGNATVTPVGTSDPDQTIDIRAHFIQGAGPFTLDFDAGIVWATESGDPPDMPTGAGDELTVGFESTDQGATFRGYVVTPATAAPSALDDLTDVNAPSPSDGDVLTWDSTPGEWVAAAPTGGGATDLDDLTDVTITTPATGQRLRYNGSQWVNTSLVWRPVMAFDPTSGLWLVVVDGSGSAVMAEG